jgi:hypothetical protein
MFNPHYESYAKAHGKSPKDMLAYDKEAWPGGCMCGFILWINEQHQRFFVKQPEAFLDRYTIYDRNAWKAFLEEAARGEAERN